VLGDLSTACEVFGLAMRKDGRTAYEVRVCSESVNVESMHVALRVPWRLSSLAQADTVIVPGINDVNRPVPASVLRAIRRAAERGARVASICTGAFVLAATGVLDGLRAMRPLLTWMEQNLSRELPLPVIARRAAMSTRTLSRRFREQVGATPAAWLAHARVRRAQRLLETTDLAIEQVAAEAGFGSAAVM